MISFLISILVLTVCSFAAVGLASRRSPAFAVVAALLVSTAGTHSFLSYTEILGQPVKVSWSEMPDTFTVVFFRVNDDETITLWVTPDRLVRVPYSEGAESELEGERESMGSGMPSTFTRDGDGSGEEGQGGDESGDGDGGDGEGGQPGGQGGSGWQYRLESRGGQVVPGTLPPKN